MAHPYPGVLPSNAKEWTTDTQNNMDRSQIYYPKWKKSNYYDMILFTFRSEKDKIIGTGPGGGEGINYKG